MHSKVDGICLEIIFWDLWEIIKNDVVTLPHGAVIVERGSKHFFFRFISLISTLTLKTPQCKVKENRIFYEKGMKEYVENMKEYEEICQYIGFGAPISIWSSRLEKFRAPPSYSLWD